MTLDELTQQIQEFCETDETAFNANIPTFIRTAEERIMSQVDLPVQRATATRTIGVGERYIGLPEDCLSLFALRATPQAGGESAFLLNKDPNFLMEAFDASMQGVPEYYAIFDEANMMIAPITDGAYVFEMNYNKKWPSLVDEDTGTWLSNTYSGALLYASLANANIFLMGEEDMQVRYENMFNAQMDLLKDYGYNKTRKDAYRSGQKREEGAQ